MALGGGTFLVQNKKLPGTYINFISVKKATANLSERGYGTMALELDWGLDNEIFEVTNGDFQKNSMKIFGYEYTHEKLKGLRDLFSNLKTLYAYRLNGGVKATSTIASAKCSGIRGNDLSVTVAKNIDDAQKFDVTVKFGNIKVDFQTVTTAKELKDNDYVTWNKGASLEVSPSIKLSGGTNGTVETSAHQTYLDKIESFYFNVIGLVSTNEQIKSLYVNFTKRMRDEVGAKFQLVVHNKAADYEGVINVKNTVSDEGAIASSLVYFVTGIEASCPVNKSCLNKKYDGEFMPICNFTQSQLGKAIDDGEFTFHNVGKDVRILSDINSMVSVTDEKGDVFKDNQSIRVIDQIANDIAVLFNTRYLGVVPNDNAGRLSLWSDIVKHHQVLQEIRAIEKFEDKDVTVEQGESKKAVLVTDRVTVVNAMAQLYMQVYVA